MTHTVGGTAMLETIVYTSVFVTDQDRALEFYTNVLGLHKRAENPLPGGPRFLAVGVKDQDFVLVLWPGIPGQAHPVQGRVPAAYTIETPDCQQAVEELKSRDVKFETEVLQFPWATPQGSKTLTATGCSSEKATGRQPAFITTQAVALASKKAGVLAATSDAGQRVGRSNAYSAHADQCCTSRTRRVRQDSA
jgi:catechol 2,3-dioxygenase-like lactoylglutathione lyase family enzyme